MLAPRKSLRPKARKKSIYGVGEKSTQSPDGMTIAEREAAARNEARRKDALEGRAARRAGRKIGSDASAASSSRMKKEEQESQDIFNMLMDGAAEMDKKAYEIDQEGTDYNYEVAGLNIPDYDESKPKKETINID